MSTTTSATKAQDGEVLEVGTLVKCRTKLLRVRIVRFRGALRVDMRVWQESALPTLAPTPTRAGLNLAPGQVPELISLLERAVAEAARHEARSQ